MMFSGNSLHKGTGLEDFEPRATHLGPDHAKFYLDFLNRILFSQKSTTVEGDFPPSTVWD